MAPPAQGTTRAISRRGILALASVYLLIGSVWLATSPFALKLPLEDLVAVLGLIALAVWLSLNGTPVGGGHLMVFETMQELPLVLGFFLVGPAWTMVAAIVSHLIALSFKPAQRWVGVYQNTTKTLLLYGIGLTVASQIDPDGASDQPRSLLATFAMLGVVLAIDFALIPLHDRVRWGTWRFGSPIQYLSMVPVPLAAGLFGLTLAVALESNRWLLGAACVVAGAFFVLASRASRVENAQLALDRLAAFAQVANRASSPDEIEQSLVDPDNRLVNFWLYAVVEPDASDGLRWSGMFLDRFQREITSVSQLEHASKGGSTPRKSPFGRGLLGVWPIDPQHRSFLLIGTNRRPREVRDLWATARHITEHARAAIVTLRRRIQLARRAEEEAERARTDAVTGLPNRFALLVEMTDRWQVPSTDGAPDVDVDGDAEGETAMAQLAGNARAETVGEGSADASVVAVGIAGLAQLGQVLGHEAVADALRSVATFARHVAAEDDRVVQVARIGDNAIALLVAGPLSDARDVARSVVGGANARLEHPGLATGDDHAGTGDDGRGVHGFNHPLRVGAAHWDPTGPLIPEMLLRRSELALDRARRSGDVEVFTDAHATALHRRLTLQAKLRSAIYDGALDAAFQPIVDVETGSTTGAEVLVRWNDEDFGQVPPTELIEIAEQSTLIDLLTLDLMSQALMLWTQQADQFGVCGPSFNLAPPTLNRPHLVDDIIEVVENFAPPTVPVTVEIPEIALATDTTKVIESMHRLSEAGIRISLDRFGSGYSTLSVFEQMPIDEIKLDAALLLGPTPQRTPAVANKILALCSDYGLVAVSTAVEHAWQAERVGALGVGRAQGMWYAAPMRADRATEYLCQTISS